MHRTLLALLNLFLVATASAQGTGDQTADDPTRAGGATPSDEDLAALYAGRCASCHVPPDTTFAVDRAWITQLADTA